MSAPPSGGPWRLVDGVLTALSQTYGTARSRALGHPAPMTRMLAQRDHYHAETALLERELAILRAHRSALPSKRRPQFRGPEKAEILQLIALRGWSAKKAAEHFVVHPNTIRNWQRAMKDRARAARLLGEPPWNRLHEAVRWTVHEVRRLCPEREFGSRTIARHLVRAGIQISRTSVRRVLEERPLPKPRARRAVRPASPSRRIPNVLNPAVPDRVWHMDMTEIRVAWRTLVVAAVLDGCSRKLVGMRVYVGPPSTRQVIDLLDRVRVVERRTPRFVVTDHGSQFQRAFRSAMEDRGAVHIRGRVGAWQINGKIERSFRTLKHWQRRALMFPSRRSVQKRLDAYRMWYNECRPHAAHRCETPAERASGRVPVRAVRYTQRGGVAPKIEVSRTTTRGDPGLAFPVIRVLGDREAA